MPHFAYLKRCSMARRSDSNITANNWGVLMRKTKHKSCEYTKKVNMTKINIVFLINTLICVKPFYFNYMLYFRFSLHNSTGEARPHLPPLTACPCLISS